MASSSDDQKRARKATANKLSLKHAGSAAGTSVKPFRAVSRARERFLSDEESRRLTNACPGDFRNLVVAGLMSGARYGELCWLVVADFHVANRSLFIRVSKSGRSRHIALSDEGVRFFAQLSAGREAGAPLLPYRGRSWAAGFQHRYMAAACRAASITPPADFHCLRHTYASRLAMKGVPLILIAAQLGHRDTKIEQVYGHLCPTWSGNTVRDALGELGIVEESNVATLSGMR